MVGEEIIREPTNQERKDFIPIVDPSKRKKSVQEEFNEKVANEMKKANKQGLPFCDRAARDDFKEHYDDQAKAQLKEYGFIKTDEIKPIKMNWDKYSDLKNFEMIEEGESFDEHLTKHNPGLDVFSKFTKYKFKGYLNVYIIMEDGPSSIRRARQKLKDLEVDTVKKK